MATGVAGEAGGCGTRYIVDADDDADAADVADETADELMRTFSTTFINVPIKCDSIATDDMDSASGGSCQSCCAAVSTAGATGVWDDVEDAEDSAVVRGDFERAEIGVESCIAADVFALRADERFEVAFAELLRTEAGAGVAAEVAAAEEDDDGVLGGFLPMLVDPLGKRSELVALLAAFALILAAVTVMMDRAARARC